MAREQQDSMSFWEHLDVLRGAIIKIALAIVVCSLGAFFLKDTLFDIVLAPKSNNFITYQWLGHLSHLFTSEGMDPFSVDLVNTGLAEQFAIHMKVAVYVGILAASPYAIYLLVRFIAPALYDNEKRYVFPVVTGGYVMFLVGMSLNYFLIFPLTFRFLGTYQVSQDVPNMITLASYVDTMMMMNLMLGILFELPVVSWLLGKLGLLSAPFMRHYRRHAIVVIFTVAAVITPTTDAFTLCVVALPIWLLYEASILLVPKKQPYHLD